MRLPFKNLTIFAGFISNDVELRHLASGDATVSLRVVSKHSYRTGGQDSEWKTIDEWATIVFYRNQAQDLIEAGAKKGRFIHVEGRRHTRMYRPDPAKDKQAAIHEIIAQEWHLVDTPSGNAGTARAPIDELPNDQAAEPVYTSGRASANSFKALG
jgi:single-stranded DNA-binding protein